MFQFRKSGNKALVIALLAVAFFLSCISGIFIMITSPFSDSSGYVSNPCGFKGENFHSVCQDGAIVLWQNNSPYYGQLSSSYKKLSLNGDWQIALDSNNIGEKQGWFLDNPNTAVWEFISIPSTINSESEYQGYEGSSWFKKDFLYKADESEGHWIRLTLHGVLLRHKLWVNGRYVGKKEGGFTPSYYDISRFLKEGMNNITVLADNQLTYTSLPPLARKGHKSVWRNYGGIYRDVDIHWVPNVSAVKLTGNLAKDGHDYQYKGQLVLYKKGNSRWPNPTATLNPGSMNAAVISLQQSSLNDSIGVFKFEISVYQRDLWSPLSPMEYKLQVSWDHSGKDHFAGITTGFRTVDISENGFSLNGKRTFLKGISKMEDNPNGGLTQSPDVIEKDISLIKNMNANFIRLAHYPHSEKVLEQSQKMGLMLSEEIPLFHAGVGWTQWLVDFTRLLDLPAKHTGMRQLSNHKLQENTRLSLFEMIERDRNSASVVMWFLGNESHTLGSSAGNYFRSLKDFVYQLDSSRPVSLAEMTYYFPPADKIRSTPKILDFASYNIYYGWYIGTVEKGLNYIEKIYRQNPAVPIFLSEVGAGAILGRETSDGKGARGNRLLTDRSFSEAYQAELLKKYIEFSMDKPYIMGISPWVFSDFYCHWFPGNPISNYNLKGITTSGRVPKQAYYTLQKIYRNSSDSASEIAANLKVSTP